ncbi:MAG: cyclic nucleotide-binding domain-containing protein [Rhodospirillales bacterium]|jgi:CRP-like cAMP-binding protein|nr:cyclic nucleotide-binding domain-containing protein [Rhodospirillales bacterium]
MAGNIPNVLERLVIPTGESVFRDGEPGECAYVVQNGLIEIVKGFTGEEVVLGVVEKGGIFGEMALIDNQPRMASARAAAPSTLIVITRPAFQKKLSRCDPFVKGLLGIFAKNIRRMADEKMAG